MTDNDKKTTLPQQTPVSQNSATAPAAPEPSTKPGPAPAPEWIVIGADGTLGGAATPEDHQLAERGAALLAQDPHYQALVSPVLCRIEVNAGVASTDAGHLCLRYDVTGGTPQEFWPHWGKTDKVSRATMLVSGSRTVKSVSFVCGFRGLT